MSRIAYVKTYQVAYPLDKPLSDSIHYMPVRAALLVELGTDDGEYFKEIVLGAARSDRQKRHYQQCREPTAEL